MANAEQNFFIMANKEPLLVLKNAGIRQQQRWRVRNIDLEVNEQEIVTLIGPNGSGKSSTVQMAIGLVKPDEGQAHQRANLRIGYMPQKVHIDESLPITTVRFMSLGHKISRQKALETLRMTGVAHVENSVIQQLSGGEFQRVLLARALARSPELLVLDEPMQGVDASGVPELYRLIVEIRDRLPCAVLLISHDLHVVMAATDRVICLNGHICCQGAPQEVMRHDQYQHLFDPVPETAMLSLYRHHHDHKHLPDGSIQKHAKSKNSQC